MLEQSLRQLNLETVIKGCQTESSQPRAQETGYCFELFRRALEDEEQAAWVAIDNQYKNLILHWLYCCSPALSREEAEEIVPQAWPKFWRIFNKSSAPLTDRFAHVGALLKYLKQCAISVLRDYERRMQRRERIRKRLASPDQMVLYQPESEQELLTRIDREKLLALIRQWVDTYVTDPQERRVLSLSFEYGLTPVKIAEQYPQEFANAQTVRRIKERILKRAKRALGHIQPLNEDQISKNGKPVLNGTGSKQRNATREVAHG